MEVNFQKDDMLLCCSDGVWEFLSNGDARSTVVQAWIRLNILRLK